MQIPQPRAVESDLVKENQESLRLAYGIFVVICVEPQFRNSLFVSDQSRLLMHRGLCIPEVVELICSVAEFPTLATLAQTCQFFQPPALSVLWRDHSNLLRLLKCLPSDLWELAEVEEGPPGLLASGTNKLVC